MPELMRKGNFSYNFESTYNDVLFDQFICYFCCAVQLTLIRATVTVQISGY